MQGFGLEGYRHDNHVEINKQIPNHIKMRLSTSVHIR